MGKLTLCRRFPKAAAVVILLLQRRADGPSTHGEYRLIKTLEQLYWEHEGKVSDKWSLYLAQYDRLFGPYRERPIRLLEIGIQKGGSLEIWSKFFLHAEKLVGCGISPDCARLQYDDPRIGVVVADANTDEAWQQILAHSPRFDLIIDDGSHRSGDIVRSFVRYFTHLNDGGLYVAEDLHCSYWKEFEGGLFQPYSSMAFFKRLADVVNHEHWGIDKTRPKLLLSFERRYGTNFDEDLLRGIHSVEFLSSLCVVKKQDARENTPGTRVIAGKSEIVQPDHLLCHGKAGTALDQHHNEWAARDVPIEEKLLQKNHQISVIEQQVAERDGRIAALHSSTSWRIMKPLRAVSRGLKWLLRNMRRALMLVWWLSTGQFSRAANASLPYYQRFVPVCLKTLIPGKLRTAVKRRLKGDYNYERDYDKWIARNDTLSNDDRFLIRSHIDSFKDKPKFSLLMPVYNTPGDYLRQAIDSVVGQLYQDWELCVVDDASASHDMRAILEEYAHKDVRIRLLFRQTNGGISAYTNTALEMASGEWIILMDHDDMLSEHALYLVAEAINSNPDAAIIYSDEDHIDATGRRSHPYFKPDWDYDLFLGQNLISHLGAYRADLARQVGGFREGFEGYQDWDFALRVLESAPNARVHHIPFILYHWRQTDGTFSHTSLARARDAAQRAVNEHFTRTKQAAAAIPVGLSSFLRIKRNLPAERPLVSIVIPTKDQCELLRTCIDSLINRTDYKPIEIVVVDNGSSETDALAFLADVRSWHNVKIVEDPRPFNFSRLCNLGVAASSGEICVLLNNDIDVINSDWLDEMVSHALRPEVGAVGAKLYYANDTLQHGGMLLGLLGLTGHAHRFLPRKSPGYSGRLNLTHSLSCVTAACLAVRRRVYDALGGFNEQDLPVAFNDVDFCVRLRQASYRIIWTPNAELYHYESLSRGHDTTPEKAARASAEIAYMREQWGPVLDNDPFYNSNLSLNSESFDLGATTRVRKPWLEFCCGSPSNPCDSPPYQW